MYNDNLIIAIRMIVGFISGVHGYVNDFCIIVYPGNVMDLFSTSLEFYEVYIKHIIFFKLKNSYAIFIFSD